MSEVVLQVADLRSYFRTPAGTAKAVDGVSFDIRKGETYALVGESGCGKSVTALSILQLLDKPAGYIAGGTISLKGEEITGLPGIEMRRIRGNRISMIFQEPMTALNPVFTVGYQISEAILLHQDVSRAEARKQGIEMLDRVGIPDPAHRFDEYPHQMSGGMRQRVMIAMALSCHPELLIADEPTTALDVTIQSQILELMRDLQNDWGTAILLITHDMGVVKENADRVGVMYGGKIVEEAPRDTIFSNPVHPYTRLLLRSIPSRGTCDQPLAVIEGRVPPATQWPTGCRFRNRCPFAMPKCAEQMPAQLDAGADHRAACFLLEKREACLPELPEVLSVSKSEDEIESAPARILVRDLKMHFPVRQGVFQRTVGHVRAVDGVDLSVRQAETLALVGESGCGKTTVGKSILQLLKPTAGSIRFGDTELVGLSRARLKPHRRKIQMIFQDPFSSLNPRLLIGHTIKQGMVTHGIGTSDSDRRDMMAELMPKVGLDPAMLDRYPHEFSGGQRQRVGIARALAVNPDMVICDEATSSLDVSVQAQILNLLQSLQAELDLSYLFITHDLSVVRYLADRVSVMYLGRIVEEGTTEEVFEDPKHPYTLALLSAVPQIDNSTGRKRIVLQGDVPSPIDPPSGCHFHPRCPRAKPECAHHYPESARFTATHTCKCVLYAAQVNSQAPAPASQG